jgi:hypothetical protein
MFKSKHPQVKILYIVVTHESKVRITYCSMVLETNERMANCTIYFQFGKTTLGF